MNNEMQVFFKIRQNYRDFACERGSSKNLGKICIKKNLGISELFALKYTYLLTSFSHQLFEAAPIMDQLLTSLPSSLWVKVCTWKSTKTFSRWLELDVKHGWRQGCTVPSSITEYPAAIWPFTHTEHRGPGRQSQGDDPIKLPLARPPGPRANE